MSENNWRRELLAEEKLNAAVWIDSKGIPDYGSDQKIRDFKDFLMNELKWKNLIQEKFPNHFEEIIKTISKV